MTAENIGDDDAEALASRYFRCDPPLGLDGASAGPSGSESPGVSSSRSGEVPERLAQRFEPREMSP